MIGYYLIIAFVIGIISMLNRNRMVRIGLLVLFLAVQTVITIYAYFHLNEESAGYFKFDALGVIFMCTYNTKLHNHLS